MLSVAPCVTGPRWPLLIPPPLRTAALNLPLQKESAEGGNPRRFHYPASSSPQRTRKAVWQGGDLGSLDLEWYQQWY